MKNKFTAFLFIALLSCQGPWSYWPENPETYQGIWISAFVVSGRPVENVCFDKMHALDEVRLPGFAFYNEASVEIITENKTILLDPDPRKPNCFVGPSNFVAMAGKEYELNATITWDSAGTIVTSSFFAKTSIPEKFEIKRAYDVNGNQYKERDKVVYLQPVDDVLYDDFKAHYYVPEYSDDVAGVLVSMVYDTDVYWGVNFLIDLMGQFRDTDSVDVASMLAKFGDRRNVGFFRNMEVAGSPNQIDSIPIISMNMPALGTFKLLFYATTEDYAKYRESYLRGADDSRIKAVYNIEGGAGIFAGMHVDAFVVNIEPAPDVKIYSYYETQESYCESIDRDSNEPRFITRKQCVEIWDQKIWEAIICGKDAENCYVPRLFFWHDIPSDKLRELLTPEQFITWCEHRNFPIFDYPACGAALVLFSQKEGKKSVILDREVKKWCEENADYEECEFLN